MVPLTASTALNNNHHGLGSPQSVSYESAIVIGSMSISGVMLLFSLAAISYVIRKRKQYRTAAASSSTITCSKAAVPPASSLSLRTVTEHLDHQQPNHFSSRSLPRISNNGGSTYSLRKPDSSHHIDYGYYLDDIHGSIDLVIHLYLVQMMTISHLMRRLR